MPHSLDESKLGEVFESLLEDDTARKMTAWEKSFVESVHDQWERVGKLSERQLEILEGIHVKY